MTMDKSDLEFRIRNSLDHCGKFRVYELRCCYITITKFNEDRLLRSKSHVINQIYFLGGNKFKQIGLWKHNDPNRKDPHAYVYLYWYKNAFFVRCAVFAHVCGLNEK